MAFEEIVRRPAYGQVAEQLREAILDGVLEPGSVLPSERELCERFGVGRTTVREALRALQAQGLVVGAGPTAPLRVVAPEALSTGPLSDALAHLMRLGRVPLSDLVDLRCALEGAALSAAARRARAAAPALAQARALVVAQEEAVDDVETFERADVAFHVALVAASENEALSLVMLAVRGSMGSHLLDALRSMRRPAPALRRLIGEHHAMLDAVGDGQGERAAELLRDHVLGFYRRSTR